MASGVRRRGLRCCAPAAAAILSAAGPVAGLSISDVGQGNVAVAGVSNQLSGLARESGDQYLAVEDSSAVLPYLHIPIDPVTGFIGSVSAGATVPLATGDDLEDVSFASPGEVFVSDETGSAIRAYSLADGSVTRTVAVPEIYQTSRPNKSFEGLEAVPGGAGLWAINEGALFADGPESTPDSGMLLRLQYFDAQLQPDGQWAYRSEPIPGGIPGPSSALALGVTDVLALPDGRLLMLERNGGGASDAYFEIAIFAVDLAGATDTSDLPSLVGASFTPVQKTLLWRENAGLANFEGMALGPALANGDLSLLLVADQAPTGPESLLRALRLTLEPVPEPGTAPLLLSALAALTWARRGRRT